MNLFIEGKTGEYSYYTNYCGYEIMFHVSTLLPYNENDPQQVFFFFPIIFLFFFFFISFYFIFLFFYFSLRKKDILEMTLLVSSFKKLHQINFVLLFHLNAFLHIFFVIFFFWNELTK